MNVLATLLHRFDGRDSSVGIVTRYGMDGTGTEPRGSEGEWAKFSALLSRLALGPTQPPALWVLDFFHGGEKVGVWR